MNADKRYLAVEVHLELTQKRKSLKNLILFRQNEVKFGVSFDIVSDRLEYAFKSKPFNLTLEEYTEYFDEYMTELFKERGETWPYSGTTGEAGHHHTPQTSGIRDTPFSAMLKEPLNTAMEPEVSKMDEDLALVYLMWHRLVVKNVEDGVEEQLYKLYQGKYDDLDALKALFGSLFGNIRYELKEVVDAVKSVGRVLLEEGNNQAPLLLATVVQSQRNAPPPQLSVDPTVFVAFWQKVKDRLSYVEVGILGFQLERLLDENLTIDAYFNGDYKNRVVFFAGKSQEEVYREVDEKQFRSLLPRGKIMYKVPPEGSCLSFHIANDFNHQDLGDHFMDYFTTNKDETEPLFKASFFGEGVVTAV